MIDGGVGSAHSAPQPQDRTAGLATTRRATVLTARVAADALMVVKSRTSAAAQKAADDDQLTGAVTRARREGRSLQDIGRYLGISATEVARRLRRGALRERFPDAPGVSWRALDTVRLLPNRAAKTILDRMAADRLSIRQLEELVGRERDSFGKAVQPADRVEVPRTVPDSDNQLGRPTGAVPGPG